MGSLIVRGHSRFHILSVSKPSVTEAVKRSGGVVLMIALKSRICENRTQSLQQKSKFFIFPTTVRSQWSPNGEVKRVCFAAWVGSSFCHIHSKPYVQPCTHNRSASTTDVLCLPNKWEAEMGECVASTIWRPDKVSASVRVWRRAESRGYVAHTLQILLDRTVFKTTASFKIPRLWGSASTWECFF